VTDFIYSFMYLTKTMTFCC